MAIQLVIFDCDGVLVDSEPLSNRMFIESLAEIGYSISLEECLDLFVGRSHKNNIESLEKLMGGPLPKGFVSSLKEKSNRAFAEQLLAVPGIEEALMAIDLPVCVASSGHPETICTNLKRTGLWPRFEGNIFSAIQVANGKPAPDLFLHAASTMQVPPEYCAVVEDSIAGVQAGQAAGMKVFAYTGTFPAQSLQEAGAHVIFDDMRELPDILAVRF